MGGVDIGQADGMFFQNYLEGFCLQLFADWDKM